MERGQQRRLDDPRRGNGLGNAKSGMLRCFKYDVACGAIGNRYAKQALGGTLAAGYWPKWAHYRDSRKRHEDIKV